MALVKNDRVNGRVQSHLSATLILCLVGRGLAMPTGQHVEVLTSLVLPQRVEVCILGPPYSW